jgi:hypothetical protein
VGSRRPAKAERLGEPLKNRLLPNRVAAAFAKTGLTPARGVVLARDGRADGMAAVVAAMGCDTAKVTAVPNPTAYLGGILKLDRQYALGWSGGWCHGSEYGGLSRTPPPVPFDRAAGWDLRRWGWYDGAAAWEAVKGVSGSPSRSGRVGDGG